jgi:hypothetical protein
LALPDEIIRDDLGAKPGAGDSWVTAAGFEIPVAILAFNRPALTRRVFDAVAERRPKRLFLIADGPRPERPQDDLLCAEVRRILTDVTWPCEIATNFSDRNLGCGRRISSGITWLFEHVNAAILIEDDCLPAASFFDFCSAMLSRFANDTRIGLVSGNNFTSGYFQPSASYYFSRYTHIWGWATWRRSWAQYDYGLLSLALAREQRLLEEVFDDPQSADFWYAIFEAVRSGRIDTWDYQLFYTSMVNSWLNVIPAVNLVTNIGVGPDATHTKSSIGVDNQTSGDLGFPLRHPDFVIRCRVADEFTERKVYGVDQGKARSPLPPSGRPALSAAGSFGRRAIARAISRMRMLAQSPKGG